jgi:hypothetical protein
MRYLQLFKGYINLFSRDDYRRFEPYHKRVEDYFGILILPTANYWQRDTQRRHNVHRDAPCALCLFCATLW